MLKLVDREELKIHSFLSHVKSERNHTIPILDQIALDVGPVIAMHQERSLSDLSESVFKTRGRDLARQLLEGVQFMHQQNVAHLDLKPDNLVVRATIRGFRLLIIDFDVSVRVSGPESWLEGKRGTKGWTAPELEDNPDERYRPIRADLWSVGQLLLWFAGRFGGPQYAGTRCPFRALAKKLLSRNPLQRPLLSTARFSYREPQRLELKRKPDADEEENEGIKRRRLQPDSPIVIQDTPVVPDSAPVS
jgi:serine/threonine protein kinase